MHYYIQSANSLKSQVSRTNPELESIIAAVPQAAQPTSGSSTKRQAGDARRGPFLYYIPAYISNLVSFTGGKKIAVTKKH